MSEIDERMADLVGGDEVAAEAAAGRLAEMGAAAAPAVLNLLDSDDADHRWWAVRVLALMPEAPADWFLGALTDPSSEVRAGAALALTSHPELRAAPPLMSALDDEDGLVAMLAAKALAKIGPAAVPLLLESFGGMTPKARVHLMRALSELRDPRSIRLMMESLGAESAILDHWASEGLERMGLNMVYVKPD